MFSNSNAYFQLNNETDGVYITFYPPAPDGEKLTLAEVKDYLNAHKIAFNEEELLESLEKDEETRVMLRKENDTPFNEDVLISIPADKMQAVGRFYPASPEGTELGKDDILKKLSDLGVKHGVSYIAIDKWLQNRQYCTDVLLAKGTPPIDGKDGYLDYKFALEKSARPALKEDGSVDFHQLDLLNNVSPGDILAVKAPEREGKYGTDVTGAIIPPAKAVPLTLKYGKNFGKNVDLSEDGNVLTAASPGHVDLEQGRVTVHNIYMVRGDVGATTGDIDFDGSVRISGDVHAGFAVKATGNIFVDGVVENAYLTAGGQVAVGLGILGGVKGKIIAGGDVSAKFIQEGQVASEGKVLSGSILHSKVSAKDNIIVTTGKGLIIGGELKTSKNIAAMIAGSSRARVDTLLEIRADDAVLEQYNVVRKKLIEMRSKLKELRQVGNAIQQRISSGETLPPEKAKLVDVLLKQISLLESAIRSQAQEYSQLKEEIEKSDSGRIVIKSSVHDGVKVAISSVSYYVRSDMPGCQFIKEGFEIKIK